MQDVQYLDAKLDKLLMTLLLFIALQIVTQFPR